MTGYEQVAWVTGGGQTNLRTSKRHLAPVGATAPQSAIPRVTLCGRSFRVSRLVPPNDYWTDGDCAQCAKAAQP